ncbi:hypothetical protein IT568_12490 [bacterium]|nr:hypothetical protein [bacterium]
MGSFLILLSLFFTLACEKAKETSPTTGNDEKTEALAYEKAFNENGIEGLKEFLRQNPQSVWKDSAEKKIGAVQLEKNLKIFTPIVEKYKNKINEAKLTGELMEKDFEAYNKLISYYFDFDCFNAKAAEKITKGKYPKTSKEIAKTLINVNSCFYDTYLVLGKRESLVTNFQDTLNVIFDFERRYQGWKQLRTTELSVVVSMYFANTEEAIQGGKDFMFTYMIDDYKKNLALVE